MVVRDRLKLERLLLCVKCGQYLVEHNDGAIAIS